MKVYYFCSTFCEFFPVKFPKSMYYFYIFCIYLHYFKLHGIQKKKKHKVTFRFINKVNTDKSSKQEIFYLKSNNIHNFKSKITSVKFM